MCLSASASTGSGRSVGNLVAIATRLADLGVELVVLDQNIDTRTPAGKLLFHMLAAIAEFERDLIIERTRDGQAVVRTTGNMRRVLGGQPPLGFATLAPPTTGRVTGRSTSPPRSGSRISRSSCSTTPSTG